MEKIENPKAAENATPAKFTPEVDAKFVAVKAHPGPAYWKGRTIDTSKMGVEEIQKLVDDKFPFIKAKETKAKV